MRDPNTPDSIDSLSDRELYDAVDREYQNTHGDFNQLDLPEADWADSMEGLVPSAAYGVDYRLRWH